MSNVIGDVLVVIIKRIYVLNVEEIELIFHFVHALLNYLIFQGNSIVLIVLPSVINVQIHQQIV